MRTVVCVSKRYRCSLFGWSRYDRRWSSAVCRSVVSPDAQRGQSTPPRRRRDYAIDNMREHRSSSRLVRSQSADITRRPPYGSTTPGPRGSTHLHAAASCRRQRGGLNLDEEQRRRYTTTHDCQQQQQQADDITHNNSAAAHRRQQFRCRVLQSFTVNVCARLCLA